MSLLFPIVAVYKSLHNFQNVLLNRETHCMYIIKKYVYHEYIFIVCRFIGYKSTKNLQRFFCFMLCIAHKMLHIHGNLNNNNNHNFKKKKQIFWRFFSIILSIIPP